MNVWNSSANISNDGLHRYTLTRERSEPFHLVLGAPLPIARVAGFMVNPSTADGKRNDPTINRWIGFADRRYWNRFDIANLFAYRATDIKELRPLTLQDAVGPFNDAWIERLLSTCDLAIVGWGPLAKLPTHLRGRWKRVVEIAGDLNVPLWCWGTAQDGQPRHPLMIRNDTPLVLWEPLR